MSSGSRHVLSWNDEHRQSITKGDRPEDFDATIIKLCRPLLIKALARIFLLAGALGLAVAAIWLGWRLTLYQVDLKDTSFLCSGS